MLEERLKITLRLRLGADENRVTEDAADEAEEESALAVARKTKRDLARWRHRRAAA